LLFYNKEETPPSDAKRYQLRSSHFVITLYPFTYILPSKYSPQPFVIKQPTSLFYPHRNNVPSKKNITITICTSFYSPSLESWESRLFSQYMKNIDWTTEGSYCDFQQGARDFSSPKGPD
jgi:hypothetical protein